MRAKVEKVLARHGIEAAILGFEECLDEALNDLTRREAPTSLAASLPSDPFADAEDDLVPEWMTPEPPPWGTLAEDCEPGSEPFAP